MIVSQTGFNGLLVLEPKVHGDSRGYFMESYNKQTFLDAGIDINWVQDNQSRSSKGVLRGLHYQREPHAQAKLVRVLVGTILDAVVDLRRSEPTFGKPYFIELSADNKKQLLVPKGFAHGFLVLSESADVFYKCDALYHPGSDGGIHYTSIEDWGSPLNNIIISEKDSKLPHLREAKFDF